MGLSCKSWGKVKSIEKKLENAERLEFSQKKPVTPKETEGVKSKASKKK